MEMNTPIKRRQMEDGVGPDSTVRRIDRPGFGGQESIMRNRSPKPGANMVTSPGEEGEV
jgi:hypothetical protein